MVDVFKRIGFFLVTISITAGIVWLVFLDRDSQKDVLDYSLNLLGKKLLAMVPDDEEKKQVQKVYDDFVTQAKQQEVAPEQIETVAANILNISNTEKTLTSDQARALLEISLAKSVKIERAVPDSFAPLPEAETAPVIVMPPTPPENAGVIAESYRDLGERLAIIYERNNEMQEAIRIYAEKVKDQDLSVMYRVDKDLRLVVDEKYKDRLKEREFTALARELNQAEKNRMIIWHKDTTELLQKDREKLRAEIASLEQLKQLEKLKHLENLKQLEQLEEFKSFDALESLESLKSLEALKFIPVFSGDSIRIIVGSGRIAPDTTARADRKR
ncbi:MAG: hypothetical protein ACOY90_11750 [Candidatus Zhuqueibacterota bacterium]